MCRSNFVQVKNSESVRQINDDIPSEVKKGGLQSQKAGQTPWW